MSISQNFPNTRPSLNLNFARSKTLDPRITFSRTSTGTYVDESGFIRDAVADEPRFDHDPETGECLGLLIEESRQNLCVNSTSSSNWSNPNNLTKSSSKTITAPSGETDAYEWTETTDTGTHLNNGPTISITSGNSYTISAFFKQVSGSGSGFALQWYKSGGGQAVKVTYLPSTDTTIISSSNGASDPTNINVTSYPNGWYRISFVAALAETSALSIVAATNSSGNASYTGSTSNSFSFWGLQYEAGEFPTSYIPTSGSTATRNPDNVSMTGDNFSDWYNQSEGTIFSTFKCDNWVTGSGNWFKVFAIYENLGSGVENNGFWIGNDANTSNSVRYRVRASGTNQFGPANLTRTTTNIKASMAVKSSDFAITINGNTPTTSSSGILTSTMDSMTIGQDILDLGYHLNGHISQLTYYPVRLPNSTLQTLTK